jgi:hypothetical protein
MLDRCINVMAVVVVRIAVVVRGLIQQQGQEDVVAVLEDALRNIAGITVAVGMIVMRITAMRMMNFRKQKAHLLKGLATHSNAHRLFWQI